MSDFLSRRRIAGSTSVGRGILSLISFRSPRTRSYTKGFVLSTNDFVLRARFAALKGGILPWATARFSHRQNFPAGLPNGSHAKLCGPVPRAEAEAARRLPPRSCNAATGDLQPP